jgi:hypothetical protein
MMHDFFLTHDSEHDERRAGDGDGVRYLAHHRRLNVQTLLKN